MDSRSNHNDRRSISPEESEKRTQHTKLMFAWKRQVRADHDELTPFAFCVADAIVEHTHSRTGCADVTQAALARAIGATSRGVQKSLQRLARRGHLQIEDNSKLGRKNRYVPIVRDTEEGTNGGSYPGRGGYERRFVGGTNGGSGGVRTAVRTCSPPLNPSESICSDAARPHAPGQPSAANDDESELFSRGLRLLVEMTGDAPESVRKLIGRWLKDTDGDAVDVLIAIEDAHQQQIADPRAWISARFHYRLRLRRNGRSDRVAVRGETFATFAMRRAREAYAARQDAFAGPLDQLNAGIAARDAPHGNSLVGDFYAAVGSPELEAWSRYERATGRTAPRDKRGGWAFPTRWPPDDLELIPVDSGSSR